MPLTHDFKETIRARAQSDPHFRTGGNLYGVTNAGASDNDGTVFSRFVGLGPFVKTPPHAARVGDEVKILGTNLLGATNVSFSGAKAVYTVISPTDISTTVPVGATTGMIPGDDTPVVPS